jgi:PIN domain nuclease of toxin-antitoxin system
VVLAVEAGTGPDRSPGSPAVTLLLDTHVLIWLVLGSKRLAEFSWLEHHRPWGVSPVCFLEIQLLAEIGRLSVRNPEFTRAVTEDPRFTVDDIPMLTVIRHGLRLDWTRDPFDRLLVAHSLARRLPLCTADRHIRTHHRLIAAE